MQIMLALAVLPVPLALRMPKHPFRKEKRKPYILG
jgi:hypothetical protein